MTQTAVEATPTSGASHWLRVVRKEIAYEQLTYWRNLRAAIFTFLLPLIFLFAFGLPQKHNHDVLLGGLNFGDFFLPGMIAFGLMGACYTNLAITLAFRRQTGQLLRRRATPIPAPLLMGGVIGSCVIVAVILMALTTVLGIVMLNVHTPTKIVALLVAVVVGAACFCSIGIAVQTLVKDADSAPPLVNLPMMFLAFSSGTFFPINPNSGLAKFTNFFPVRHLNALFRPIFDPRVHGIGIAGHHLINLALWTVGAALFAARRFKWAPSTI